VRKPLASRELVGRNRVGAFTEFLKPATKIPKNKRVPVYGIVKAHFPEYSKNKFRLIPVLIGDRTRAQAEALTEKDVERAASFQIWYGKTDRIEILAVSALRSPKQRKKIAGKIPKKRGRFPG
jgi:hypothetical protein